MYFIVFMLKAPDGSRGLGADSVNCKDIAAVTNRVGPMV